MYDHRAIKFIPDLEWCKKLRDIGWNRKTYFEWFHANDGEWHLTCYDDEEALPRDDGYVFAPTVGEMGLILIDHGDYAVIPDGEWRAIEFDCNCEISFLKVIDDEKEANARAKMIVWLVDNKHLDLKNV